MERKGKVRSWNCGAGHDFLGEFVKTICYRPSNDDRDERFSGGNGKGNGGRQGVANASK